MGPARMLRHDPLRWYAQWLMLLSNDILMIIEKDLE
jgi:hypothetical protein